jgi:hypothetical protein
MPSQAVFTRFWLAWLAAGVAVEALALVTRSDGCTLSEGWRGTVMGTRPGRIATVGLVAWLGIHLLAETPSLRPALPPPALPVPFPG